jgi:hypothetical protein
MKKQLFKLYLIYTDLILVTKIDPIALTITLQLIDPGVRPLACILCYAGLAPFDPSAKFSEKTKK